MKTMLLSIFILSVLGGFSQTVIDYTGNGNEQFGGAIGKGKLTIQDTPGSVYFTLTRGPGLFDSLQVFYLDAQAGGYSNVINLQVDKDARQFSAFLNSNNSIILTLDGIMADTYGISVVNSNGQVVISKNILLDGNAKNLQVQMPQRLVKGIYRVVLQSSTLKIYTSILVQ